MKTSSSWSAFTASEGATLAAGGKGINRLTQLRTNGLQYPSARPSAAQGCSSGTIVLRVTNQSQSIIETHPQDDSHCNPSEKHIAGDIQS